MTAARDRLGAAVRGLVTRGRVVAAALNPTRCLLQVSGLADEVKDGVELMLPYGQSAFPGAGGSVILLAVGASRSHVVALCADDSSLRIPDLQPTEFGFRDARGQQIVFRQDKIEITTTLPIVIAAPTLTLNGNLVVNGGVTVSEDVVASNVSLVNHPHGQVQPGSGQSGPPVAS